MDEKERISEKVRSIKYVFYDGEEAYYLSSPDYDLSSVGEKIVVAENVITQEIKKYPILDFEGENAHLRNSLHHKIVLDFTKVVVELLFTETLQILFQKMSNNYMGGM